ncbi:MAG: YaaR family protein [Lachnospiraceae bacterium]|nr:YaaR family protein [Lachnospiraceae bacterium]
MDIKINQTQQVKMVESNAPAPEAPKEDFSFTLISKIAEADLQEKLAVLIEDITKEGKKIQKHMDVRDMKQYRALIKEFMNEIVTHSHKFERENFLDKRGRHRVYGMIKLIDENLDALTEELLKEEKDAMAILTRVDEIRGLLLDIMT